MLFIKKILAFVYLTIMAILSGIILGICLKLIPDSITLEGIRYVQDDIAYMSASCVLAFLLFMTGIIVFFKASKSAQKNRMISFKNPDGEVSISLSALEEYVQKEIKGIPGIKDARARVDANKKGINMVAIISAFGGENIPGITEQVQLATKSEIQSMLGIEENVNVKVEINRIMAGRGIPGRRKDPGPEEGLPFQEEE